MTNVMSLIVSLGSFIFVVLYKSLQIIMQIHDANMYLAEIRLRHIVLQMVMMCANANRVFCKFVLIAEEHCR